MRETALVRALGKGAWGLVRACAVARTIEVSKTAVRLLLAAMFGDDVELRRRAADVTRRISEVDGEPMRGYADELAGLLAELPVEQARARWHLGLVVARLAHTREQRLRAAGLMELLAADESTVVRCSAVEGIALLACQESSLWSVAEEMAERALREGTMGRVLPGDRGEEENGSLRTADGTGERLMRMGMRWAGVLLCGLVTVAKAQDVVRPGEVWRDTAGAVIQAHGGGILQVGKEWFWFGEDRTQGLEATKRYVSCYRSPDLVHWESRGRVLALAEPEDMKAKFGGDWILERPKVFWVAKTRKYVMYFHADAAYKAAEVGVAVSDKVDGPYTLVKHFRPLGQESRDIGQFVDDDRTNYLIFESRPTKGFYVARLTDDGMDVTETAFVKAPLEGGALVRYAGTYYVIGSHMTGWKPNPNVFATAKAIEGPWSEFKELAPDSPDTWGSQSSMLVKVTGTKATTVIYVGDVWKPKELWDSRYVWMPVEIGGGAMKVPQPAPWGINVRTGVVAMGAAGR